VTVDGDDVLVDVTVTVNSSSVVKES